MKLEEAVEMLLAIARNPLTNEVSDEDAIHACEVVENFFAHME